MLEREKVVAKAFPQFVPSGSQDVLLSTNSKKLIGNHAVCKYNRLSDCSTDLKIQRAHSQEVTFLGQLSSVNFVHPQVRECVGKRIRRERPIYPWSEKTAHAALSSKVQWDSTTNRNFSDDGHF